MNRESEQRQAIELLCTDMLVPRDHLLRKIDAAVDFTHIYDLVEELYCEDNGRPSIDPVVLFKLVLIQHLFGIRSLRQTMRDVEVNVAYRWFLGYTMSQPLPHFATISYAFRHRFTAEVIEGVFRWVLEEVARAGYLSPEVVFVDGTHIKANANLKKHVKKSIPKAARHYQEQLMQEVDADRAAHGKKPLKKDDDDDTPSAPPEEKTIIESTTDPESGVFHKGEHKKCFAYEAHTVCEKHGYVLEVEVTPGNVHDSVAFDTVFERLIEHYPEVEVVTADAGYKTPWICKQVIDSGRTPSLPYKRPMTKQGNLPWYEYVYDEYYDCVLCPQYKVLEYATTNRDGYREYKSKGYICQNCPVREQCTQNKQCVKTVTRHVWQDYLEQAEDIRHSPLGKATYALRSQTIERVFADAKEKHDMRYTPYRGLAAVTAWVKLKFAALNLKKLAIHKWLRSLFSVLLLMLEATSQNCEVASLTNCMNVYCLCFTFAKCLWHKGNIPNLEHWNIHFTVACTYGGIKAPFVSKSKDRTALINAIRNKIYFLSGFNPVYSLRQRIVHCDFHRPVVIFTILPLLHLVSVIVLSFVPASSIMCWGKRKMADIYRIERTRDYTVMGRFHLWDRNLSMKANISSFFRSNHCRQQCSAASRMVSCCRYA